MEYTNLQRFNRRNTLVKKRLFNRASCSNHGATKSLWIELRAIKFTRMILQEVRVKSALKMNWISTCVSTKNLGKVTLQTRPLHWILLNLTTPAIKLLHSTERILEMSHLQLEVALGFNWDSIRRTKQQPLGAKKKRRILSELHLPRVFLWIKRVVSPPWQRQQDTQEAELWKESCHSCITSTYIHITSGTSCTSCHFSLPPHLLPRLLAAPNLDSLPAPNLDSLPALNPRMPVGFTRCCL